MDIYCQLDFRLKENSPALKLGFQPFDTSVEGFGITAEYPERFIIEDKEAIESLKSKNIIPVGQ